ncbi:RelA/SpoT domain-containing protein [Ferrimonas marina]|uniref:RelA/SpoT domain-containing protein n=1 Tax=Ferrimonas marina TaxID=299255 RepID=A0A1M5YBD7_9GAMM|nr:RelA/SpoT domain-containing protein [Ferrimonas marina]SHI09355.1 hypothetical protein SAMN02745129_4045 [Ferrimonas marina]
MFKLLQTAMMVLLVSSASAFSAPAQSVGTGHTLAIANGTNALGPRITREERETYRHLPLGHSQQDSEGFYQSLRALYAAETIDAYPRQDSNDFATLMAQAELAQQELAALTQTLAGQYHAEALVPGVKSQARAEAKLHGDLDGDAARLTDLARASLVADDVATLVELHQAVAESVEIVRLKNRFKTPKANGYRDLNLVVRLPQSGHLAELQLHLDAIAQVKNGAEHDIYEQIQALTRQSDRNEFDQHRITQLQQQSMQLYANAWHHHLTPVHSLALPKSA